MKSAKVTSLVAIMYPNEIYMDDLIAITNPKGVATFHLNKLAGTFFSLCVLKIEKEGDVVTFAPGDKYKSITIPQLISKEVSGSSTIGPLDVNYQTRFRT